jgi:hypothetical protein
MRDQIIFLSLFFLSCAPSNDDIVKYILPKEYNFKIISCEESNMLYFEGIDGEGNHVQHNIPDFWGITESYSLGDSIIKKKGEKNLKIIKPDTVLVLHLGGKDGPLYPEEQDSIFKMLINDKK